MKNVLILGAGISGLGAADVLSERNKAVTVSDLRRNEKRSDQIEALEKRGVRFCFGPQTPSLLDGMDTVLVSPVIPRENPVVTEALSRSIPVISEIELAYRVAKVPILAVTGTNGKTTTTKLLGEMIHNSGIPSAVAGNLGLSLSREAEKVPEDGLIAAEVSSFQLEWIDAFRPKAAVILNITPDHFERHHTMEAYVAAKARIFENMGPEDCLLLNREDPYTEELSKKAGHTCVCLFSTEGPVAEGAFVKEGTLFLRRRRETIPLVKTEDLLLKGKHNWSNALAAAFLAHEGGVPLSTIREGLLHFKGLEHRIEFVRTLRGVSYYNDSKATNTDAAEKGMGAFGKQVILIAGGHDKETPLSEFMGVAAHHVKRMILIGEAADRFEKAAEAGGLLPAMALERASSMKDAVERASKEAVPGDVVLLSPACSSFDMYSSYQERGRDFKSIVNALN